MNIALLTAGGTGNRMGQDIPKQFMTIDNVPVIIYTLKALCASRDGKWSCRLTPTSSTSQS